MIGQMKYSINTQVPKGVGWYPTQFVFCDCSGRRQTFDGTIFCNRLTFNSASFGGRKKMKMDPNNQHIEGTL